MASRAWQRSARLQLTNADGSASPVRLSYAGSNDQPYRSVGRWLLDAQGTRWQDGPLTQAARQVNGVSEGRIAAHHGALTAAPTLTTSAWCRS